VITTDDTGHAIPGLWQIHYTEDWKNAYPGDTTREPGQFIDGKWTTTTPAWDNWWFERRGAKPPRRRHYLAVQMTIGHRLKNLAHLKDLAPEAP
jgi:hypothetical protein